MQHFCIQLIHSAGTLCKWIPILILLFNGTGVTQLVKITVNPQCSTKISDFICQGEKSVWQKKGMQYGFFLCVCVTLLSVYLYCETHYTNI